MENEYLYVIANLTEQEISAIALEKLKKTNTDNELVTYAAIKGKYYAKRAECAEKIRALESKVGMNQSEKLDNDIGKIY